MEKEIENKCFCCDEPMEYDLVPMQDLVINHEFGCACCNKKSKSGEYRSIYIPWSKSKAIMGVCDLCKDHHFIPKKSKKSGNPLYVGGSNIPCTWGKAIIREDCRNG